jgi:glycoprotein-N-acetylgalactosamine 3-beta-galactosyltransferase
VENLRYMLSGFNTSDPLAFGSRFKSDANNGYMNGVAGYALSRKAVERFVEGTLNNESRCLQDDSGLQDLELGEFQV